MTERGYFWNKQSSKSSRRTKAVSPKKEISRKKEISYDDSSEVDDSEFDDLFSREVATLERTIDEFNKIINDVDITPLDSGFTKKYIKSPKAKKAAEKSKFDTPKKSPRIESQKVKDVVENSKLTTPKKSSYEAKQESASKEPVFELPQASTIKSVQSLNGRASMDPPSSRERQFSIPKSPSFTLPEYNNEESRDDANRERKFDPLPDFELSNESIEPTIRHIRCVDLANESMKNKKIDSSDYESQVFSKAGGKFKTSKIMNEEQWIKNRSNSTRHEYQYLQHVQTEDLDPVWSVRGCSGSYTHRYSAPTTSEHASMKPLKETVEKKSQEIEENQEETIIFSDSKSKYNMSFETSMSDDYVDRDDDDETTVTYVEEYLGWCGMFDYRYLFGGDEYPALEHNSSSFTFDEKEFKSFVKAEDNGSHWQEYKTKEKETSSEVIFTQSSLLAKSNDELSQRSGRSIFKPFKFKTTLERMTEAESWSKIEEVTTYSSSCSSEHEDSTLSEESYSTDMRQGFESIASSSIGYTAEVSQVEDDRSKHATAVLSDDDTSFGNCPKRFGSELESKSEAENASSKRVNPDPPCENFDDVVRSPRLMVELFALPDPVEESDEEMEKREVLSTLNLEPAMNEKMPLSSPKKSRELPEKYLCGSNNMNKNDHIVDPLSTLSKDELTEDSELASSTFGSTHESTEETQSDLLKHPDEANKSRSRRDFRGKCRFIDENTKVDDMLLTINSLDDENRLEKNEKSNKTENQPFVLKNTTKTRTRDELDIEKYLKYLDAEDELSQPEPLLDPVVSEDDDESENLSLIDYGMLEKRINQFLAASPRR